MDSSRNRGDCKPEGNEGEKRDLGISGFRDPKSLNPEIPKSPPVRARVYQYSRNVTLAVGSDTERHFHSWFQSGGTFDRPFLTRALPGRAIFAEAQADLDRFAKAKGLVEVAQQRVCRVCGCTDATACTCEETGETCHWVEADLCSECDGKEEAHHGDTENTEKEHHAEAQGAKERRDNAMWKVRRRLGGVLDRGRGRATAAGYAAQPGALSQRPGLPQDRGGPRMERALANILLLCQREILHEDRDAIEEECRAALGKAWGVNADKVWTPDLAEFQPEEDHHGDTEGTEKTTQAKAQSRQGEG